MPRYGALGVMNDFRGVTSAYGYGDSYLVTWLFRAWTLATKQKFMDFLYGFLHGVTMFTCNFVIACALLLFLIHYL